MLIPKNGMVGVGLWLEFLNYLALKQHNDLKAIVDAEIAYKLEKAKTKGVEAVDTFLNICDTDYDLKKNSSVTLAKMLTGTFNTYKELEDYEEKNGSDKEVCLLVKEVDKEYKSHMEYIIESIFVNN